MKRKTENKIARGFAAVTPDVYNNIASQCPAREKTTSRKTGTWGWKISTCALALALIAAIVVGGVALGANGKQNAVAASVTLDVNPSISIQLNGNGKVVDVEALNHDGEIIIGNMDFKGVQLEVTVNAIIGSMLRNGYLSTLANSVLVSVDTENNDVALYNELVNLVSNEITLKLKESQIEASVVSQWIKNSDAINALASKYGISVGKAQLIQKILSNTDNKYSESDLAALAINDLNIILGGLSIEADDDLAQSGTASAQKYIGQARALEIAFAKVASDLTNENVLGLECKLDFDDGMMMYEVEFYYGTEEYSFDIGAITGEIISFERETKQYVPDTTQTQKSLDELKVQVLTLAGVADTDKETVTVGSERSFFWGKNVTAYSLWLEYDSTYFEYEIDVYGKVLYSYEQMLDSSADRLMNRDEVRSLLEQEEDLNALDWANVKGYRVITKTQQDADGNDVIVYVATFSVNEVKYTYTIDALNKTVIDKQITEQTSHEDSFKDWFGDEWNDDWGSDDWDDDDWDDFFGDDWNFDFDDYGNLSGGHKNPPTGTVLSQDKIKTYLLNQLRGQFGEIALQDTFEWKLELDSEHGRQIYEVEFKWNHMEFECDVDAVTGELISGTYTNTRMDTATHKTVVTTQDNNIFSNICEGFQDSNILPSPKNFIYK